MTDGTQAGTPQPEPDDRDDAPQGAPAGTPESGADDGDGGKSVTLSAGEFAEWKRKVEEANRRLERMAEIESERQRGGPAPTPRAATDESDAVVQRARNAVARLRQAAAEGNEDALAVVAIGEEARTLHEQTRIMLEMDKIPEAEHDKVEAEMARTGIRSPKVVYKLMREQRVPQLEAELAKAQRELEALRRQKAPAPADTRPPAASVVQTSPDAGKKMGLSEYNAAYASGDAARIAAAKAARQAGNIDLSR